MSSLSPTLQALFIEWEPPVKFLFIRYYALMWMLGLAAAYLIVKRLYRDQKIEEERFDPLFLYCFVGILAGARLGHCLFYEPAYYLGSPTHFIEMLLPIHYRTGEGWSFTGYEGLASHGGTLGIVAALILYSRRYRIGLLRVTDLIAVATPLTACFIRLGNLMNSEILGRPTDVPWAFVFVAEDQLPRHPAQLYEALAYLLFFAVGLLLYRRFKARVGSGLFLGYCLFSIFTFRFFVEFLKERQVGFEEGMALDMGQLLSLPFVAAGLYLLLTCRRRTAAPLTPWRKTTKR